MSKWKKYALVAAVAAAAGFAYIKSSHNDVPVDLRDAVADKASARGSGVENVGLMTEVPAGW